MKVIVPVTMFVTGWALGGLIFDNPPAEIISETVIAALCFIAGWWISWRTYVK